MRCATIVAMVCLCGALTSTYSQAALIWDSGDPATQGYGPVPGSGVLGDGYTPETSPGILTQSTTGSYSTHYGLNAIDLANELNAATGWFVEWRANTLVGATDQVDMQLSDGDKYVVVSMLPDTYKYTPGPGGAYTESSNIGSGFHTYRVTRLPANGSFELSVDGGAPLVLAGVNYAGAGFVEFGDSTSAVGDSQAEWDYVALNGTPIPEPASLVLLLCAGLLGLSVSRKR